MTLANPDVRSLDLADDALSVFRERVFQRDDHTCQRCLRHISADHLHIHRRIRIEDDISHPSTEPSSFVTLCYLCHGVQHPDADHFDRHRQNAPLFPELNADPDVARVNAAHPEYNAAKEAIWLHHRMFNRDDYTCQRCKETGVSPHGKMDGRELTAYFLNRPLQHGFACIRRMISVCHPCYRVLSGSSEQDDWGEDDPLLPHPDAHPEVAVPRPPETDEEEQTVREFVTEYCLKRDGHTCSRCRTSFENTSPSDTDAIRLYTPNSEETYDPRDHIVLCRPCSAVVDPDDTEFEMEWLPDAQIYPDETAHQWGDVTKTRFTPTGLQTIPDQITRQIFEKDSHQCQRCTSRELPEEELVAYPTFDVHEDIISEPFSKYTTVCRPCASVMYHDGDHGTDLEDLHSQEPLDEAEFEHERESARPEATYPVMDKTVDVTRGPVNRKERLLLNPVISRVHAAWKIGGTISIATLIFFAMLSNLLWLSRDMISLPVTGWHSTPWLIVGGALIVLSLGTGATARWIVADITSRMWNRIDPTIESYHYRIDAANEWRRTLIAYGYMFLLPYIMLVIGQGLFIALLYLDWALSIPAVL